MTTPGVVLNVAPGRSRVRLASGEVIVAKNHLNVRTPLRARVLLVRSARGWAVVGRER